MGPFITVSSSRQRVLKMLNAITLPESVLRLSSKSDQFVWQSATIKKGVTFNRSNQCDFARTDGCVPRILVSARVGVIGLLKTISVMSLYGAKTAMCHTCRWHSSLFPSTESSSGARPGCSPGWRRLGCRAGRICSCSSRWTAATAGCASPCWAWSQRPDDPFGRIQRRSAAGCAGAAWWTVRTHRDMHRQF